MFRASSVSSPGVALWKIIEAEQNPMRQNILAPAREALARGLGVIDALKAMDIFDHGTIAILAGSEKANKLTEGIPHAIHSITQKKKNSRAIMGTMGWLGFDVVTIVQSLYWGQDMVLGWFRGNAPQDPAKLEEYNHVVNNLELTWNILIYFAFAIGGLFGLVYFFLLYEQGKARLADGSNCPQNSSYRCVFTGSGFFRFDDGGGQNASGPCAD